MTSVTTKDMTITAARNSSGEATNGPICSPRKTDNASEMPSLLRRLGEAESDTQEQQERPVDPRGDRLAVQHAADHQHTRILNEEYCGIETILSLF